MGKGKGLEMHKNGLELDTEGWDLGPFAMIFGQLCGWMGGGWWCDGV